MTELSVFVIDGSVNVRKCVGDAVKADSRLSFLGVAPSGSIALQKLGREQPDVIVLDTDLPDIDCVAMVKQLCSKAPQSRVILFGVSAVRGSSCVLDSIAAGASDYLLKPATDSIRDPAWEKAKKELVLKLVKQERGKLRFAARTPANAQAAEKLESETKKVGDTIKAQVKAQPVSRKKYMGRPELLCIGSSTGGPNALAELFKDFSKRFPVPVVITQHMPPMFTKMLAQRLNGLNTLAFHEGEEGMPLKAGHAYIAPGGKHMTVCKGAGGFEIRLNSEPPENSCRPAVDVMLRSVAESVGGAAMVAILTGMGKDGFLGCQPLVELGATVIAQDEETSVVWGMPGFVATGGLADQVLPLGEISKSIHEFFGCALPAGIL